MRRRLSVTGPLDPASAWARYEAPSRWSDWAPQIRGVEAPEDRLIPGLRGVVRVPLGLRVGFRVDAVDPAGLTWAWTARAAGVTLCLEHDLAPAAGSGTVAGLTIRGPAPVVVAYAPLARLALARLVR